LSENTAQESGRRARENRWVHLPIVGEKEEGASVRVK